MSLTNTTRTRYRTHTVGKIFISVDSIAISFMLDKVLLKSDLTVNTDLSSGGREFLSRAGGC